MSTHPLSPTASAVLPIPSPPSTPQSTLLTALITTPKSLLAPPVQEDTTTVPSTPCLDSPPKSSTGTCESPWKQLTLSYTQEAITAGLPTASRTIPWQELSPSQRSILRNQLSVPETPILPKFLKTETSCSSQVCPASPNPPPSSPSCPHSSCGAMDHAICTSGSTIRWEDQLSQTPPRPSRPSLRSHEAEVVSRRRTYRPRYHRIHPEILQDVESSRSPSPVEMSLIVPPLPPPPSLKGCSVPKLPPLLFPLMQPKLPLRQLILPDHHSQLYIPLKPVVLGPTHPVSRFHDRLRIQPSLGYLAIRQGKLVFLPAVHDL